MNESLVQSLITLVNRPEWKDYKQLLSNEQQRLFEELKDKKNDASSIQAAIILLEQFKHIAEDEIEKFKQSKEV